MRRKEHLLLYMAKAAVLTEVMNSHRPELLEDRALRGSQPGRQAHCQRVEAKLRPHLESYRYSLLLSPSIEALVPGFLRLEKKMLYKDPVNARYYYYYHSLDLQLTHSYIHSTYIFWAFIA